MDNPETEIELYLSAFSPRIGLLAQELRSYLKKETQPTMEIVGDSTISVNIGYGFTKKAWDCFCAIIVYSKHINISFPSGAQLTDPFSLLQGKGSRIRHIRISTFADIQAPGVKELLLEARANALGRLAEPIADPNTITTLIKQISGPKRRRRPED